MFNLIFTKYECIIIIMNAYFLEYLISSTTILLVLIIGALVVVLLNQNLRVNNFEQRVQILTHDNNILQQVFLNTATPYLIVNEKGTIVNINDHALKLLQKKRDEVVGTLFDSFVVIKSSEKETRKLDESITQDKEYILNSNIRIDNQVLNCQFVITGILQGTEARYLVGIFMNDSTVSEYDINLRDQRINRLEDMSDVGFFVFNHETNDIRWSRGMYKLLGMEINKTKPSLNFISQIKTSNEELQNIILSIKEMKPYFNTIKIKGGDNVIRLIELELSHQEGINHDNATTLGLLKQINSIETVLDNFSIGDQESSLISNPNFFHVALLDENYKILDINKSFLKDTQSKKEDIIGFRFDEIFKDIDLQEDKNADLLIVKYNNTDVLVKEIDLDPSSDLHMFIGIPFKSKEINLM